MLVSEYLSDLIGSEVKSLSVADIGGDTPNEIQEKNISTLIGYLNRANEKVHERFGLIQREILLQNTINNSEHDIPVDILYPISAAYSDGTQIQLNNERKILLDCVDTNVSLMFPAPFKVLVKGTDEKNRTEISLIYCSAPQKVSKVKDFIDLNMHFNEPILNYMAYLAHGGVDGHIDKTNNTYYMRYVSSCNDIVTRGLMTDNVGSNVKLEERGYV